MLIAEQQLILIYPGQERGSSALHLSERRREEAGKEEEVEELEKETGR